ncbi:MAG: endolytic transglycosylase MltG [Gemmatimonadaceae bacterium]|nr:endolytic transglycosylase MltG [Gemmatimonadaceae bacterium]
MILRRSSRCRLAALVIAVLVGVAGCGGRGSGDARVVVPRGASLRVAADSLERAGVVGNATMFRLYASLKGRDRSIRAGTYRFTQGTSWGEVLADLHGGKGIERSITIPEGWSLQQIVPQLARVLGTPVDSVTLAVRDTALLHALDVPTPTLEGYLFPDTYVFPEGTTARQAVHVMVARFRSVWRPEWDQQLQSLSMSRNDVMSLAAIVEKEARRPEERPVIAAVYLNRLKIGMRLQADPTVQYALGQHVTRVLYKHLTTDSPYNTYRYAGLPPGPIASPGRPSIVASLYPANVPYRFFVAYPDGHHEFTTNFAQHSVAVKRARREWDSVATARHDTQRTLVPASVLPGVSDSTTSIGRSAAKTRRKRGS